MADSRHPRRRLAPWLAAIVALAMTGADDPSASATGSMATFPSGGKAIRVERFEPTAPGRHPAILILHGSDGAEAHLDAYRGFGRELARRGYVAHLVRYMDRTGHDSVPPDRIAPHFAAWMGAVADAIEHARAQPDVAPDAKVGLLGFSLGAYLSLSTAALNPRVGCVVDYYGGLPSLFSHRARRMPPTLILHGDRDDVVPVAEAHKLRDLLHSHAVPHDVRIYEGQGHGFRGDVSADADRRALAFLETYLPTARLSGRVVADAGGE